VLDEVGFESLAVMHPMLRECLIAHHDFTEPIVVTISSAVPPGSSLGTSAAVGVALIAALTTFSSNHTSDPSTADPHHISRCAHIAETSAGLQSGVQDHAGAAFGGINRVEVTYPMFQVSPVDVSQSILEELDRRLFTVYLGKPHDSSEVHRMVICRLEQTGSGAAELEALRRLAQRSIAALSAGDLDAYGTTFDECVTAQRALHPLLINDDAELIIAIATRYASHVKINGAGGSGGSVTVLGPSDPKLLLDLKQVVAAIRGVKLLPLRLWPDGVSVIEGGVNGDGVIA
jgi:D-glycero-alpha-D-manno-heptose-7-phosphate kinase